MSLHDRLFVLAESLKESAEFPASETKDQAICFGQMLSEHENLPEGLKPVINQAIRDLMAPRRPGFDSEYKLAAVKAAFFFLGIYSALSG